MKYLERIIVCDLTHIMDMVDLVTIESGNKNPTQIQIFSLMSLICSNMNSL